MTHAQSSPSTHEGHNFLWNVFVNPNLPRALRLGVRLPLAIGVATAGVMIGAPAGYNALAKNYGCAEIPVEPRDTPITLAQQAAQQLGVPNEQHARDEIIAAAQRVPGSAQLDPAYDALTTCVTFNPISGWSASATITRTQ